MEKLRVFYQLLFAGAILLAFVFVAAIAGCSREPAEELEKVLPKNSQTQDYHSHYVVPRQYF